MPSPISQVLLACLLLAVIVHTDAARRRRPVIPGKTQAQPTQPPVEQNLPNQASPGMADMERRMLNIEQSTLVIKSEMKETKSENTRLKHEIQRMSVAMEQLDAANNRVAELERMLFKFENFFGVLYTELPDVFAREMPVNRRLSALNEYIGNRETELMALRPNPPVFTADPSEHPVDEKLLGVALNELNSENSKLRRRLDDMERKVVDMPTGTNRGIADQPDEVTLERLQRLERLMALLLAQQVDDDTTEPESDNVDTGVDRSRANGGATMALSATETEIVKEELESLRSISSTRKSLFSAAATTHTFGEAGVWKPVIFDEMFATKGNHFQEQNSTFICGISGYYFITFTIRSYDNRYMGVTLLKNGEPATTVSAERETEKNAMVTQSVILHLEPGDKLWLTLAPSNNFAIYSDHHRYCTFTGFLIFKGS